MNEARKLRHDHTFRYNIQAQPDLPPRERRTRESRVRLLTGERRSPVSFAGVRPAPGFWGEPKLRMQPDSQKLQAIQDELK